MRHSSKPLTDCDGRSCVPDNQAGPALVIFDWDGTLMDSTARIVECLCAAACDSQLPVLPAEQARSIIGLGLPEAIRQLYPDIDEAACRRMRDHYAARFIAAEASPCQLYPGVIEVLSTLREQGTVMAVATGKSRRGLDRVWASSGIGEFFIASRCADESRSKPHPAMLHQLLAELSMSPQQALMVGDTCFDVDMAHNAGMRSTALTWGAHSRQQLINSKPHYVIDDIAALMSLAHNEEIA